jgi:GxxExxY protein
MFHSQPVGRRRLDLVVEGKVIVELKAVEQLRKTLYSQVIQYLSATRLKLGLLFNFGSPKGLEHRRLVLSAAFRERSAPRSLAGC